MVILGISVIYQMLISKYLEIVKENVETTKIGAETS